MARKLTLWRITYTYQRYSNARPVTVNRDVFNILEVGAAISAALVRWPDVSAFMVQKMVLSEDEQ